MFASRKYNGNVWFPGSTVLRLNFDGVTGMRSETKLKATHGPKQAIRRDENSYVEKEQLYKGTATYEGTAIWTIVSNRMSKRKHESRYALKTCIGGVKDKEQQGEGVSKKTGKFNDYLLKCIRLYICPRIRS